jgi:hypothetical protein
LAPGTPAVMPIVEQVNESAVEQPSVVPQ